MVDNIKDNGRMENNMEGVNIFWPTEFYLEYLIFLKQSRIGEWVQGKRIKWLDENEEQNKQN